MEDMKTCLKSEGASSFDTGIRKLIPRYRYLSLGGSYILEQYSAEFKTTGDIISLFISMAFPSQII
jgi:hypothetical protein